MRPLCLRATEAGAALSASQSALVQWLKVVQIVRTQRTGSKWEENIDTLKL